MSFQNRDHIRGPDNFRRRNAVVGPDAENVGRPLRGSEIISKFQFPGELLLVEIASRSEHGRRHPKFLGHPGSVRIRNQIGISGRDVSQRLAVRVEKISGEEPGEVVDLVADGDRRLFAQQRLARAPEREVLNRQSLSGRNLQLFGHARRDLQNAAKRIARILSGERTVQKIDALDFLRRDQAPPRRADGVVIADQRGQQKVVGINELLAEELTPQVGSAGQPACRRYCVYAQKARHVFDGVFRVDDVDRAFDLLARDALHRIRQLPLSRRRRVCRRAESPPMETRPASDPVRQVAREPARLRRRFRAEPPERPHVLRPMEEE